jgi:hypothetical protein
MKLLSIFAAASILLFSLVAINEVAANGVSLQDTIPPTLTPTYDPLAEPILPENPSELELGGYWYWHNCMTCHGDLGQGLSDEFRAIWPEDHQNCWSRGCHGGNNGDEGFPIPTYVPPLVSEDKLSQFSQQGLFTYLKSTHPPQTPGVLEDEQYQAIVLFLFSMNDRQIEEPTPVPTLTPTATLTPIPDQVPETDSTLFPAGMISIGIIVFIIVIWRLQFRRPSE